MRGLRNLRVFAAICGALVLGADTTAAAGFLKETSDASAAVALGDAHVVVADDETNVLRAYHVGTWGAPVARCDLNRWWGAGQTGSELDLEGAAVFAGIVYWIGSHGPDRKDRPRAERRRLFATRWSIEPDGAIACDPFGTPYVGLVEALLGAPEFAAMGFQPRGAKGGKHALEIEALDFAAEGSRLYLGLRRPMAAPEGDSGRRAILVPLENPEEVVTRGARPRLAAPLLFDLDGLAIRAMTYSPSHSAHFIVAGPDGGGRGFALYRWSGDAAEAPRRVSEWDDEEDPLQPEALVAFPGRLLLLVLSDDGDVRIPLADLARCQPGELRKDGSCPNKRLRFVGDRTSRLRWVDPRAPSVDLDAAAAVP